MNEKEKNNFVIGSNEKTDYSYGMGTIGKIINGRNDDHVKVQIDLKQTQSLAVVGTRGSGKSNSVAVLTEELLLQSLEVGILIVDPLGAHRYIDEPNQKETQVNILKSSGLEPIGFNSNILVPTSAINDYQDFASGIFAIKTSDMMPEDWCRFWNFKPNSQQSDLITILIRKCINGYYRTDSNYCTGNNQYSIEDLNICLVNDKEINENGFIQSTITSIGRRFNHLLQTGLFSTQGTSIQKLFVPGVATIIDLSHPSISLSEKSAIIGLIVRKALQERVKALGIGTSSIPNSWIIIEESQLFTDDKLVNNATSDIKNYIKTGRSAGCSIVLSTQQPSKIPHDIQSQLDIIISMRLNTIDDLNALKKCIPASYYKNIVSTKAISKLKPGQALITDNYSGNKLRIVQIRPRLSKHGGENVQSKQIDENVQHDYDMIEDKQNEVLHNTQDDGLFNNEEKMTTPAQIDNNTLKASGQINNNQNHVVHDTNDDRFINLEGKMTIPTKIINTQNPKTSKVSYLSSLIVFCCGFILTLLFFKTLSKDNMPDVADFQTASIEEIGNESTLPVSENIDKITEQYQQPAQSPQIVPDNTISDLETKSIMDNTIEDIDEEKSIMKILLSSITLLENIEK